MYVKGDIIMSKFLGQKFLNKQGQELTVISKVKGKTFKVRFTSSGLVREANIDNIKAGKCKDLLAPTSSGGFLGNAKGYSDKERVLWKNMLFRVKDHENYKDASVCDRWLCLENFLEDIRSMEGYAKWLEGGYDLDKDIKYKGNKVYSKQTCMFVPRKENQLHKAVRTTGKTYTAKHEDGTSVTFCNQRKFAMEYGLCTKNLGRAILKGGKVKGWTVTIDGAGTSEPA